MIVHSTFQDFDEEIMPEFGIEYASASIMLPWWHCKDTEV